MKALLQLHVHTNTSQGCVRVRVCVRVCVCVCVCGADPDLHVIKYEEQSLYRESLEELEGVKVCRRVLVVEGWRGARRPLQIWPETANTIIDKYM